uniref:Uncharacterized protein n=1 Tax=Glossina pallidipes TaxID=7398 RepID=A0A1A9Z2F0_GLOPL
MFFGYNDHYHPLRDVLIGDYRIAIFAILKGLGIFIGHRLTFDMHVAGLVIENFLSNTFTVTKRRSALILTIVNSDRLSSNDSSTVVLGNAIDAFDSLFMIYGLFMRFLRKLFDDEIVSNMELFTGPSGCQRKVLVQETNQLHLPYVPVLDSRLNHNKFDKYCVRFTSQPPPNSSRRDKLLRLINTTLLLALSKLDNWVHVAVMLSSLQDQQFHFNEFFLAVIALSRLSAALLPI